MHSPETAHKLRSLLSSIVRFQIRRNFSQPTGKGHRRLAVILVLTFVLGAGLLALTGRYAAPAQARSLPPASFLSDSYASVTRGMYYLKNKLLGSPKSSSSNLFATINQTVTVSGCYFSGGISRATVSVEVAWTGLANNDTITVTLPGSLNGTTRTITQNTTANPPVVTPQVVAFEIPATLTDTVTASAPGPTTDMQPVVSNSSCAPLVCNVNQLGGTVFNDYNADGIKQAGETNGVANVSITAVDNAGLTYTTTSNGAGRYCLTIPPANYPVRVEFTNIPAEFAGGFTTRQGADNGSSVQFAAAPDQNVDIGVNNPADYCQANPKVMVPCFFFGNPLVTTGNTANDAAAEPAMVRFNYADDGVEVGVEKFALASEIGPVWGIAYKKTTGHLFGATTVRRHAGLGPQGLGGLYVLNANGPMGMGNVVDAWSVETQLGINVQDPGLPFGGSTNPATSNANRGLTGNKFTPSVDAQAFPAVGKLGFGDIDISDDGDTLFFVNQYDKKLYGFDISTYNPAVPATRPTAADVTVNTPIPDPVCVNGEWRPFGAKYRRGVVYVGGVCNAITSGLLSDLRAAVYAYDVAGNSWTPIFNFPLSYPKGSPLSASGERGWHAWTDNFATIDAGSNTGDNAIVYSVPMFTDIEFDVDGTMVLGFNDRTGMQFGRENYAPTGAGPLYTGFVGGDTLRAFFSSGTFVLENNAKAGPVTGFAPNNNEGPGFGEFYFDNWRAPNGHTETTVGGLAIRPGSGEVVSSSMDPHDDSIWAAGVRYMSNSTGARTHALAVYSDSNDPGSNTLGKSTGVGDVELRCDTLNYLDIGNRVWMDVDLDGIQDPGEMPIAGVTVHLYREGGADGNPGTAGDNNTAVATAVTAADGTYHFTSVDANNDGTPDTDGNLTDNTGLVGGVGILPNANYLIRFDNPVNYQAGGPLYGKLATQSNAGGGAYGVSPADLRDSDGTTGNLYGLPGGNFPEIVVQHLDGVGAATNGTGAFGEVDHTLDMGMFLLPVSIGNTVWFDTNNNGSIDAGEAGKDGVLVDLFFDADGNGSLTGLEQTPVARQLTAGGGYYLFTQATDLSGVGTAAVLTLGRYFVGVSPFNFVTAGAPATIGGQPFTAGMLTGYLSSATTISGVGAVTDATLAANTDTNGDNGDDGVKQGSGFYSGGVLSGLLDISPDGEPVNETTLPANVGGGATPGRFNTVEGTMGGLAIDDNDSNVTVDFGFYYQCLGNVVFHDDGAGTPANGNNAIRDAGEAGVSGVTVRLYASDGTTEINVGPDGILGTPDDATGGVATNASGIYSFCGLPAGSYIAKITAPPGSTSSNDIGSSATPDGNVDSDDNGLGIGGATITSNAIALTPGSAGALNNNTVSNANGSTTNPTLDFALILTPPFSIGNTVWLDTNNNGVIDAGEVGKDGVLVELFFDSDNNGSLTGGEQTPVARQLTSSGGHYLFTQTTNLAGIGTGTRIGAGRYFVGVSAYNFSAGLGGAPATIGGTTFMAGMLAGFQSSATTINNAGVITDGTVPAATDGNTDNVDDGSKQSLASFYKVGVVTGALSGLLELSANLEPLTETTQPGNVTGGVTPGHPNTIEGMAGGFAIEDDESNLTVDFGFYNQKLGDVVFSDDGGGVAANYDNGIRDAGENGLDGISLTLFSGDGTTEIPVGPDGILGTADDTTGATNVQVTLANGLYQFCGLPQGAYIVRETIKPGYKSSEDVPASTPTPNGNVNDDDNGAGEAIGPATVSSVAITLTPGSAGALNNNTVSAATGTTTNPTLDFGQAPVAISIGNTVWNDVNNNGLIDPMEKGVDAVRVELFYDTDNSGALNGGELTPVAVQLTSSGGYYLFTQKTDVNGNGTNVLLDQGRYFIGIAASNFGSFGQLAGFLSSGTVANANGVPTELPIPGNQNTDNDQDNFDDGQVQGAGFYAGGVLSGALVIQLGSEPANETTAGMPGATGGNTPGHLNTVNGTVNGIPIIDANSNITVDFGFYSLRLGNLVWYDKNNNGLRNTDGSEPGIAGVRVALYFDRNNNSLFEPNAGDGAPVQVATTDSLGLYLFINLVPGNYFVYLPETNFDFDRPLHRLLSSTPTELNPNLDVDNNDNGLDDLQPDINGIRTNLVTLVAGAEPDTPVDTDNISGNLTVDFGFSGRLNLGNLVWKDTNNNGVRDSGEPGVDGVTVHLYKDRNNNGLFEPAGADAPVLKSTPTVNGGLYNFIDLDEGTYFVYLPPNNFQAGGMLAGCLSSTPTQTANSDVDNDDNGVDSSTPEVNGIVTSRIDIAFGTEPGNGVDGDDANGNLTIDLGFYPPMNLGNLVWKDNNNNGVKDVTEPGMDGVTVELIRDANANNLPDDAVVATLTTSGGGFYNFTDLLPGNYFVRVAAVNFQAGGALVGCFSSTPTQPNPNSDTDNDDNGVDSPTPQTVGITSGVVTLAGNSEPVNDGDGANGNLTVDFGFYPPMNLGNLVWKDFNNNGLKDASEPGMDGVTVELFRDVNGNGIFDAGADQFVASQITAGGGLYNFTGLQPGAYLVRIPASNFQVGGPLYTCLSSTTTQSNPNNDTDNDDNGLNNPTPESGGIVSNAVLLIGNSEPTNEGDGANGNLSADFGFYSVLKLGNLVWKDNDNDGQKDAGEPGVDGVRVELYTDRNNNGTLELTGADAPFIAFQLTSGGGLYQFTGLLPGRYFVVVAALNFQNGGTLADCYSSTPTMANADGNVDNDDNGIDSPTQGTTGVASGPVVLVGQDEPDTPVDGDDRNGNQTVDFGFYPPLNLGNLIWKDDNNNGLKDANEPGMNGVTVELIRDANSNNLPDDAVIATQVTSAGGVYNFTGLPVGTYFVRVAALNFTAGGALAGCLSSTPTQLNPNSDTDNDDNGIDNPTPQIGGIVSGAVTLTVGGEPPQGTDGDGTNGNLTVDFGFYPPMNLGNLVWKDFNNNGLKDAGEPGMDGVTVELIRDANANNQPDDAVVATLTTGGGGFYNFTNLTPGNYFVRVAAVNFNGGGALAGCLSSTPTEANPNADVDNNDNGVDNPTPQTGGVVSGITTLVGFSEPAAPVDGDGPNGNLTVDFGFYPPLNLGNLVWKDFNNDGLFNNAEPAVQGVVVELFRDNGDGVFNAGTDTLIPAQPTSTTNASGNWSYTGLTPGTYFARVAASNFGAGGPLESCLSSEPTESNPNADVDNNDNGVNNPNPGTNGIVTGPITLQGNTEPTNDGDGPNGNNTVDFGFVPLLNLGNLVWKDYNNNGTRDGGEPGIGGVTVQLIRDTNNNGLADDAVVATTTTSASPATLGQYAFTGLTPGVYIVRVATSNFQTGGTLEGCVSSTPTETNPNADVDNNDNGLETPSPAASGIVSGPVTLIAHAEPTNDGDGDNGNLTVDFGFFAPLNLGNLVFKDLNNDGLFGAGEMGVAGVTVQLYRETNATQGLQLGGGGDTLVNSIGTASNGQYQFSGLPPGDYYVYLPPANFTGNGPLAGCGSSTVDETNPNADVDNNDNGLPGPNGGVVTGVITLAGNSEPTNDGDGPNGNQTVDLGFYPPVTIGNLIWKDLNNNGQRDAGEMGVPGVVVQLYRDNGDGVFNPATDTLIPAQATSTTDASGNWSYSGLPPGNYFVRVAPTNFQPGGVLAGCLSSEPTPGGNGDNGVNTPNPATDGVPTGLIMVVGGGSNPVINFGFIPLVNLGNLVWKDNNNNGLRDAGEPGMNGVTVQLYRDTNGNNQLDPGVDQLAGTVLTAGTGANAGQYAFTDLPPANYIVFLPSSNFTGGGALAGCLSSTPDSPNPNNDVDNDDNGLSGPNGGIVTGVITLTGGGEPINDGDGAMGNLTVDLGFFAPMNLGNLVWKDSNNNGLRDGGEPGIDGVLVELFKDANNSNSFEEAVDTASGTQTTAGGGLYNFTNLTPGVYFVRVARSNFQPNGILNGCLSSSVTASNPNNDVDDDDNGLDTPPSAVGILSNAVTLVSGAEPTNDGDGANGNLSVDFGFYSTLSLGNLVFKDFNNNGLRDAGEPGIDSVTVELIRDANNNNLPDDLVVATTNTTGGGLYQFSNLQPGNYFVRVATVNFQGSNTLTGCSSSTTSNANPNSDIDNDDNGIDNANPANGGITSGLITLLAGTEPPTNVDSDGTSGNQTVDFGFFAPLNLGNLVWKDTNNNGLRDSGEPGVDGVVVTLFRDSNNNGVLDLGTDVSAGTATTAGGGLYQFTNLLPGNYFVQVAAVNFTAGNPLFGCSSSIITNAAPNSDIDNDDNGIDNAAPQTGGIASGLVTLSGNSEPTNDGDGANGNLTVDFGFITGGLSLGNLVWKDLNQNSLREPGEPGIANVTVELIRDVNNNQQPDDAVIATTTTNAQGIYAFTGLSPATYFVRVAASNFAVGGPLYGCDSSLGTNLPNNDRDNDDNGSDSANPAGNPPTSGAVTLTQGGEPTNDGDGADGNQTVDFGFIAPLQVTVSDPAECVGPGAVLQIEAVVINTSGLTQQNNAGPEVSIDLPPVLAAVAGSCTSQGGSGTCTITGTRSVTWNGSFGPGERVIIRYRVQLSNTMQSGQQYCITTVANFDSDNNGSNESQDVVTVCGTADCQSPGPGTILPGCSTLIYPAYTSGSSNPNLSNTRINLTNAHPNLPTAVHLFFVDGTSCSVTDAYLCLTANQTTSFLMSDLDPGVTGYIVAVAVDANGCPTNFNYLLGDEYVKFESGHLGNLTADCGTAIPGGVAPCQLGSSTATLNFDGQSYSRLPQTVALDSIFDRGTGNETLLILNRIGGDLGLGPDKLGPIFGLLYNDQENPYSFTFNPSTCQFRSVLSNNFPRTSPRIETVIPAGHTGWLKFSSTNMAMTGAAFNRNPNSSASAGAFNGAHNLHTMTLNAGVSITIPVFPPNCL